MKTLKKLFAPPPPPESLSEALVLGLKNGVRRWATLCLPAALMIQLSPAVMAAIHLNIHV